MENNEIEIINVKDIVEENGKTIHENNLEKTHKYPVGSLVEVKYDKFLGNGACKLVHARLWVYSHDRDCDGEPLYSLGEWCPSKDPEAAFNWEFKSKAIRSAMLGIVHGFGEESLTLIPLTEHVMRGGDALSWDKSN
jgi:hypothetical protein